MDIVIMRGGSLEILGGNGDGTFQTARLIDSVDPLRELRNWAHSADMNGDGHRDLIVPDSAGVSVLNVCFGTGALTFAAPIVLATADGMSASEVTSADFNGDGRRDLALVNLCCSLSIYLNQGATFSRTDLPWDGRSSPVFAPRSASGWRSAAMSTGRWPLPGSTT